MPDDCLMTAENDLNIGFRQDAEELSLQLLTSNFPFMSVGAFCAPG